MSMLLAGMIIPLERREMYKILSKQQLTQGLWEYVVEAPLIAYNARPGQFVLIRIGERGEKIPLGLSDWDRERGTVTLVFGERGKTTVQLARELGEGDALAEVTGPLGRPAEIPDAMLHICVGEGSWGANLYPLVRELSRAGRETLVILSGLPRWRKRFAAFAREVVETEDPEGPLAGMLREGAVVWTSGPVTRQREWVDTCREKGASVRSFLHPLMLDGIGICGACRVLVDGKWVLACIDGPVFDGNAVDWDILETRLSCYRQEEELALRRYLGKEEA